MVQQESRTSPAERLRALLGREELYVMPCCFDALSARLVERAGFRLSFMSGFAVSAARLAAPAARLVPWIVEAAGRAQPLLSEGLTLAAEDFDVLDDFIGHAYGVPSAASIGAVRLAGAREGLVLDPIYTGKAMAGLAAGVRDGRVGAGESVVFIHSGGVPGLFANAEAFGGTA